MLDTPSGNRWAVVHLMLFKVVNVVMCIVLRTMGYMIVKKTQPASSCARSLQRTSTEFQHFSSLQTCLDWIIEFKIRLLCPLARCPIKPIWLCSKTGSRRVIIHYELHLGCKNLLPQCQKLHQHIRMFPKQSAPLTKHWLLLEQISSWDED